MSAQPLPQPRGGTSALALVLRERDARDLLTGARNADVRDGGSFASVPTGVQLWSGPYDGADGTAGSALHLGSVEWSYDTPSRHYITVHRVTVTAAGVAAGETTASVLARVLGLASIEASGHRKNAVTPHLDSYRWQRLI